MFTNKAQIFLNYLQHLRKYTMQYVTIPCWLISSCDLVHWEFKRLTEFVMKRKH